MATEIVREPIPFEDPQFYVDDPYPVLTRLQREDPVHYYEPLDVFILTKIEDIREAASQGELFSSGHGLFLNDLRMMKESSGGPSVFDGFFPADAEHFAFADPPRHKTLRGLITPAFAAKNLNAMRPVIDGYIEELLGRIEPGRPIDFVAEVADHLPIMIAQRLLGIEGLDIDTVKEWSDALEAMNSVDTREEIEQAKRTFAGMNSVFEEEFKTKRGKPGDGLVSSMLNATLDGEPVSESNILTYCTTVLAAGSDTTRALLTGTMLAFADFPDQLTRVKQDRTLVNTAIEESLRWVTPARSFVRTATADTTIRGKEIKAGQRIFLLYAAGNFDEEAFENPFVYDVGRKNAQQNVAFGFGPHSCIAAQLVRMQMRTFLNQFLDKFSSVRKVKEPTPIVHVLRHSWYDAELIFEA
ncbi:cytochrome P450 [Dactylosporangium sp. NPDC051484]|uniref:cytochrome P450 n=1 Tax=Dactylosporangium sp. NPDC051484 TaxID=3154942 RepID=UPI00344CE9DF